jgi:hypothetical protein
MKKQAGFVHNVLAMSVPDFVWRSGAGACSQAASPAYRSYGMKPQPDFSAGMPLLPDWDWRGGG